MKMNVLIPGSKKTLAWTSFTTGVLLAGVAMAQPSPPPAPHVQTHSMVVTTDGSGDATTSFSGGTSSSGGFDSGQNVIKIESIEPDRANEPARAVTWLGLSTEEASEALASQLGLKPGQGLLVDFVAPGSPASRSGIQKFDVIEQLGDQTLVDPVQLRKLVQMQNEGDTVKLTLYRSGKKQTVSAILAKRTEGLGMWSARSGEAGKSSAMALSLANLADMDKQMIDKKELNAEVQRSMEEARKEIQDALRQSAEASRAARAVAPVAPVPPVPPMAAVVGDGATVTVTKDGDSVKTIVRSDDSGEIVIIASPRKHLTAHDEDGKLLFDGEIESPEQQAKVPAALWKKIKPMLQQIKPAEDSEPQPHAQSGAAQKI